MVSGGDVGVGLLRVPQLCAKPYPAEPRCEVCGLPRVFYFRARFHRAVCFLILFFRLPFGVWVVSVGDSGFLFLGLPFGISLFADFSVG